MAYITDHTPSIFVRVFNRVGGFLELLAKVSVLNGAAEARFRRIELLNAKTDEELEQMNLRREDIPSYVFRDLMHI